MTEFTTQIEFDAGDLGYIQADATFKIDYEPAPEFDTCAAEFVSIKAGAFVITRDILAAMISEAVVAQIEDRAGARWYENNRFEVAA